MPFEDIYQEIRSFYPKLLTLRQELHRFPELSYQEEKTSHRILQFFKTLDPDEILTNLGGYGLAFVFKGKNPGPTLLFRCELDALPIHEADLFPHHSTVPAISHKCGHDGHMTILAGFGQLVAKRRLERGKIILLYQPAEEIGEGALAILRDPKFKSIQPDWVFAVHNLPAYPLGEILLKTEIFSCASRGIRITLKGKTSHAAHPEEGINPTLAMCQLIQALQRLPQASPVFSLVTVVYAKLGEIAFGTTPGEAQIMATLRTETNSAMKILSEQAVALTHEVAQADSLQTEIHWCDDFPASQNHEKAIDHIQNVAQKLGLKSIRLEKPFRWSEDFGHFLLRFPGALIGIGSGIHSPQLHHPDYDFPDALTSPTILFFWALAQQIIQECPLQE